MRTFDEELLASAIEELVAFGRNSWDGGDAGNEAQNQGSAC